MKYITGAVTVEYNGVKCIIEDELGAIINNFCMETLLGLVEKGKATYKVFEYHGKISLEAVDEFIGITGDFVTEIIVPREEFIADAFDCASRYILFLRKLNIPHFANDLALLEETHKSALLYLKEKHPSLIKNPC